jgi:hypothetical protein
MYFKKAYKEKTINIVTSTVPITGTTINVAPINPTIPSIFMNFIKVFTVYMLRKLLFGTGSYLFF